VIESMPPRPFRLAIVVLAYHRPEQLAVLLKTLRHPQVTVYLHIDSGSEIEPFQAAVGATTVGHVVWLPRHRSAWATIGIVDAEMEGIARAVADGCSYVLVISGEDFPLRPVDEIVAFTEENQHRSFVQTYPLPYEAWPLAGRQRTDFYTCTICGSRYTCIPRGEDTTSMGWPLRVLNWGLRARFMFKPPRRFPPYLHPFGGQQWLNLAREAAEHVLEFTARHPDYRQYHVYTACSDEMFIQSILMGTPFAQEHEVVPDDLRFLMWTGGDHPKTLRSEDLPEMLESTDLFARKIVAEEDPRLFAALREMAAPVSADRVPRRTGSAS
jgi:hypothetical protein